AGGGWRDPRPLCRERLCARRSDPRYLRPAGLAPDAACDPAARGHRPPPQDCAQMTRQRRRLYLLLACGPGAGTATALALMAFQDNLVFFIAPSDVQAKAPPPGRTLRLGGLVEAGSVQRTTIGAQPEARFRITDGHASVDVSYAG